MLTLLTTKEKITVVALSVISMGLVYTICNLVDFKAIWLDMAFDMLVYFGIPLLMVWGYKKLQSTRLNQTD